MQDMRREDMIEDMKCDNSVSVLLVTQFVGSLRFPTLMHSKHNDFPRLLTIIKLAEGT